jgi:hypothetical protein
MTSPLRFPARRAPHRELPWPAATADIRGPPTHVMPISAGPQGYRMFRDKADGTVRAVFRPSV